jgi:Conserved protein containing a Zn-ribbon-like motif, possibly RNA-binding
VISLVGSMIRTHRSLDQLELVGGNICLDFTNSVNCRPEPELDYLHSYEAFLAWAEHVQLLTPQERETLSQLAQQQPGRIASLMTRIRSLRETIYRLFADLAAHKQPNPDDLETIQSSYAFACQRANLVQEQGCYRFRWNLTHQLESPLWPVIYAAGELLRSEQLQRLKLCPSCGWLFIDLSKNGQRRWCSMNSCGARDKMRRYHQRQRDRLA